MEHQPVLLEEVLNFLEVAGRGTLLDATVGLGGHAHAFLSRFEEAKLVGLDRDTSALEVAKERLAGFGDRVRLYHAAFDDLGDHVDEIDGALFDLGVSSPQLDVPARGFSFRHDGPLDMRMDQDGGGETAEDLVNRLTEKDLGNLIYELGDERASRRIAAGIVAERRRERIRTTGRLAEIVRRAVRGRGRIDAATRTFQALRLAVNDELGQLERGVDAAVARLRPGGRVAVISFHSGEDRFVKNAFRSDERLQVLTKKVVRPSREEARANRRARSAKLRVAERRS